MIKITNLQEKNKGITLIALVITIIVLIVLSTVSINLILGENGIIQKTKQTKEINAEQTAKEKLETELANLLIEKETISNYNEEYFNNYLIQKGFIVNEDIVIINGYQFKVDKSIPKIIASLGKGKEIEQIDVTTSIEYATDYTKANLKIEILYSGNIVQVKINGEEIEIPQKIEGKYNITKEIFQNENYSIYIKDENEGYKLVNVLSTEISDNLTIATTEELITFRDKVNKGATYEGKIVNLVSDLDLAVVCGQSIGSWEPIACYETNANSVFKGIFNGNNHIISNLYINGATTTRQALFGANVGTIKDLTLENASINTSGTNTAILVGYNMEGAVINNVIVKGKVISTSTQAAGVVGNNRGTISQAINYANVEVQDGRVGGICGTNNQSSEITSCYNYGSITGKSLYAGGISGQNYDNSAIKECYNYGVVNGTGDYVGGISGTNLETSTVTKSHNYGVVNGNSANVGRNNRNK